MTRSADSLCDLQTSEEEIKIRNGTFIDVEGHGLLIVVFPRKTGKATVRLDNVASAPDLASNFFPVLAVWT